MGLFSDAFRGAVQGVQSPEIFAVVDVDLPAGAGGRLRLAASPVAAGSLLAQQRAPGGAIGEVPTTLTPRPSDLAQQTTSIEVLDTDFRLQRKLSGRYNCRRSTVTAYWGHRDVDEADWFVGFRGIVDDWSIRDQAVTLNCKTDDHVLEGYIPKKKIFKSAFPGAPASSLGLYAPIVLGIHDAQGLATGMVQCVPVSIDATLGYRYMVSLGVVKDVPRVYKNGALQTVTTHYTVTYGATAGGLTYTAINMVSATVESDVITCDVEGLTDDGTTGGAVLTGPGALLKWMLNNVVYGEWAGGAYVTDAAPIDEPAFAAAASYFQAFGREGAQRLGGSTTQTKARDVVGEWLKSHLMARARWSNAGLLGLIVFEHRFDPYPTTFLARDDAHDLGGFGQKNDAGGLLSKVSLDYLFGTIEAKYWGHIEVQDLQRWRTEPVPESLPLPWGPARFV